MINTIDKRIEGELDYFVSDKSMKYGLMQDLLTGKVPVNVSTPELVLA